MRCRWLLIGMAMAAVLVAAPPAVIACSGTALMGDDPRDSPDASVIFIGTAVRVEDPRWAIDPVRSGGDGMRWTFVVDDVERGMVGDRVTVQTARFDAACGFPFRLGARYRVVASDGDGGLRTSTGSGTRGLPALPSPPAVEGSGLAEHPFPWALVVFAGVVAIGVVTFIRRGRTTREMDTE